MRAFPRGLIWLVAAALLLRSYWALVIGMVLYVVVTYLRERRDQPGYARADQNGGDGCAELAEICDLCPDTAEGLVARDSCERTVESADDESCATAS